MSKDKQRHCHSQSNTHTHMPPVTGQPGRFVLCGQRAVCMCACMCGHMYGVSVCTECVCTGTVGLGSSLRSSMERPRTKTQYKKGQQLAEARSKKLPLPSNP